MKKDTYIQKRQKAIKELIASHEIDDQAALVALLAKKFGIDTNQAVVSRDLRQLGITKKIRGQKTLYELEEQDVTKEILCLAIIDVKHNESMIVVKTLAGLADFVGDYLDAHASDNDILGTIAGENVIFITPISIKKITKTYTKICKLLHIKMKGNIS